MHNIIIGDSDHRVACAATVEDQKKKDNQASISELYTHLQLSRITNDEGFEFLHWYSADYAPSISFGSTCTDLSK